LPIGQAAAPADRWNALPEDKRAEVLALLARLIARGVISFEGTGEAGW
jgi:hypothetical protein